MITNYPRVVDVSVLQRLLPLVQPWLPTGLVEHWLQVGSAPFRVAGKPQSYRLRNVPMPGCAPKTRAAIARAAEGASTAYTFDTDVEAVAGRLAEVCCVSKTIQVWSF